MSDTLLFERIDELVEDCNGAVGNWEDVLRRARVRIGPAVLRRRLRLPNRRVLVLVASITLLLVILFATPAFGILSDWVGRRDFLFRGKTAPLETKVYFADLSLGQPSWADPRALASQTRKVGVFRSSGQDHTLYVAPTRKGGFCTLFTGVGGGCWSPRPTAWEYPDAKGAINPYLLNISFDDVGGDVSGVIFAKDAASLTINYVDGTSEQIPFVFVSKPIDAGFFLHGFALDSYAVVTVNLRDSGGRLLARWTPAYASVPPRSSAAPKPTPLSALKATAPLQRSRANGVSAVAGKNGVVIFDLSGASEKVRSLLGKRSNTTCFTFTTYHSPGVVEGGFRGLPSRVAQVYDGLQTPFDGCTIEGDYGHSWPDRLHYHAAVEIAFTARGKRYFADHAAAADLAGFVRSNPMRFRIRRLSGNELSAAISVRYGDAIERLPSLRTALPPDRIGFASRGGRATYLEYSTTGRRFSVVVENGKIVAQNVRSLASVY